MDKYDDKVCTPHDLRQFAFAEDNPTVFNFNMWLGSKTGNKYTLIETQFINDVFDILEEQMVKANNIHDEFREKYWHVVKYLFNTKRG